jgi:hypothetical protein
MGNGGFSREICFYQKQTKLRKLLSYLAKRGRINFNNHKISKALHAVELLCFIFEQNIKQ